MAHHRFGIAVWLLAPVVWRHDVNGDGLNHGGNGGGVRRFSPRYLNWRHATAEHMIHAGATVLDHLPRQLTRRAAASISKYERLKLMPYETVGLAITFYFYYSDVRFLLWFCRIIL